MIDGTVSEGLLRGTWTQTGGDGQFVFALSEDGTVLTGRFGNGEYWNGFRVADRVGDLPRDFSSTWN